MKKKMITNSCICTQAFLYLKIRNQEYLGGEVPVNELRLMNYKPPGPGVWTG